MNNLKELISFIESCSLEEYKSLNKEFYLLYEAKSKRDKEQVEDIKNKTKKRFLELINKTSYEEPIYPSFDYEKELMIDDLVSGSCVFTEELEAKELIAHLVNQSYCYGHYFTWAGPGVYEIVPSWKYDHDHEIIYSAHYKLKETL